MAEVINDVNSKIQTSNSSWNVIYDQIFCRQNTTVFDNSIMEALNRGDYVNLIFIARLAELNGYSSKIIDRSLEVALQKMSMCGSLPITYIAESGTSNMSSSFCLYDRYMINAYRYAQNLNVSGWNINQAYLDFQKAYLSSGPVLFINPETNFAHSNYVRYYDEYAETISLFLEFAQNGVNANLTPIADEVWGNTRIFGTALTLFTAPII